MTAFNEDWFTLLTLLSELMFMVESEQVPVGSIPRLLTVNVYGESTRAASPGDAVRITGILVPLLRSGFRLAQPLSRKLSTVHSRKNMFNLTDNEIA